MKLRLELTEEEAVALLHRLGNILDDDRLEAVYDRLKAKVAAREPKRFNVHKQRKRVYSLLPPRKLGDKE